MERRQVRSTILCMVLGDGCLFEMKRRNKKNDDTITLYGGFTMDHGILQRDYVEWKAKLLQECFPERSIKLRQGHKGKSIQVSVCDKRFRSWKKHFYKGKYKDVPKILKYIDTPTLAIAIWLMDDGYVDVAGNIRICDCSQPYEAWEALRAWFKAHFNVTFKVKTTTHKQTGKTYYWIKFNVKDSLTIYQQIRPYITQIDSMKHKFRNIERIYQRRSLQRTAHESVKI